jgi:peptidoglycan biosynthesis protein MviN/MurJ (putative lipid II flippase)
MALMAPYVLLSRFYAMAELPFYGARDTKTPLIAQVALAVFYSGLMLVFSRWYDVHGFPLARSVSYLLGGLVLAGLLQHRYGSFHWRKILGHGLRVALASGVLALVLYGCRLGLERLGFSGLLGTSALLGLTSAAGLAAFLVTAPALGLIDCATLQHVVARVLARLKLRRPQPSS